MGVTRRSARAITIATLLAASLATLLALALWTPADSAPPSMVASGTRARGESGTPAPGPSSEPTHSERVAVVTATADAPAAGSATHGAIHVRTFWRDGTPAADIDLSLLSHTSPVDPRDERSAVTDAAGEATFANLPTGRYRVHRSSRTTAVVEVVAGTTAEVELLLEPGFSVAGRVVDVDGAPVIGAGIWVARSHVGAGFDDGRVVAESDARGEFLLQHVDELRLVAALAPGRARSRRYEVSGADGARVPLVIVVGPRGATIRGVVRDHRGQPLAAHPVRIGPPGRYGVVRFENGFASVGAAPIVVKTTIDGRFEAHAVPTGDLLVTVFARGGVWGPWTRQVRVVDGAELELEIALEPGFRVEGIVRGADTKPVPGAVVWVEGDEHLPTIARVRADARGHFALVGLPPGRRLIQAEDDDAGRAETTLDGQPGQELLWDPVLAMGLVLRGRLVDEADASLPRWRVEAMRLDEPWQQTVATTDASGRFKLVGLPDAPHRILVMRERGEPARAVVEPLSPGGGEVTVRVHASTEPSAYVQGRVLGGDGRGAPASHVTLACAALHWSDEAEVDPDSGAFRFGPLPAGEYRGRIWSTLHVDHVLGQIVLAAHEHRDLGAIKIARGGALVVDLAPPELVPTPTSGRRLNVTVLDADGGELVPCFREGGQARPLSPLPAGDYAVSVYGTDIGPQVLPIRIVDGDETRIGVRLASAASCTFRIVLAPEVPRDQAIDLIVTDAGGADLLRVRFNANTVDRWKIPFAAGLPVGELTATALAANGQRAVTRFTMGDRARAVDLPVR